MISLRRTYLIARRDFLGYVKTWGFWISFLLPFIFGALGGVASNLNINVDPVRYETILDETGQHEAAILDKFKTDNLKLLADVESITGTLPEGSVNLPENKTVFVTAPALILDDIQPYLKGERRLIHEGKPVQLNGVLHIRKNKDQLNVNYWSANINSQTVKNLARQYFNERSTRNYLATGGLTPEGLAKARRETVSIEAFDPTKTEDGDGGQAVTLKDKVPFYVAGAMAMILWLTVFSGSYMLLTSMLEEKLNKLMEMMLASTRFSEIIFGKLIGVAALTITAMLPYLLIGAAVVVFITLQDPEAAAGLANAFSLKLFVFFPIFLILGYMFYGAFFIALGALAESMQDAQTLTTPIMLLLTSCILVVPLGLNSPDSPLLTFAAWFPLSAPFAAIVRLPLDPPWWELALSALFLFVLSLGVIWVAGRIFRFGVLSGTGIEGVKSWFSRVIFRRKTRG